MRHCHPVITGVLITALLMLNSCRKTEVNFSDPLRIRMNYTSYSLTPDRLEGIKNCSIREYEVTAYNGGMFFKLKWDCDTLRPGIYPGTYWYTNFGKSYGTTISIAVSEYNKTHLKMDFSGGIVSGSVNYTVTEK